MLQHHGSSTGEVEAVSKRRWSQPRVVITALSLLIMTGCGAAAMQAPVPAPQPSVVSPPLDPRQVGQGRQLYVQNCARCHGQQAEGATNWQQPDARGDLPPPPHDDHGHTWRHPDAQLVAIIQDGLRDPFNKTPELTMPAFRDRLSDEEIMAIVTYFKSLWSPEQRAFQTEQNLRPPMPSAGTQP